MNVSLPPQLEKFVEKELESDHYESVNEMIFIGLQILKERDRIRNINTSDLREELKIGVEKIRKGKIINSKKEERLRQIATELQERGYNKKT